MQTLGRRIHCHHFNASSCDTILKVDQTIELNRELLVFLVFS